MMLPRPLLPTLAVLAAAVAVGCGGSGEEKPDDPREAFPAALEQLTHWYEGGTLEDATVAQWRVARFEDKLATAAAWLSTSAWHTRLQTPADYEQLKPVARRFVDAMDREVERAPSDDTPVSGLAQSLIVSGDFAPR